MTLSLNSFIKNIPKVELHLHIEGSFEPELMFEIAQRNKIELPFKSVEEIKQAYQFNNLQEFLDIYYQGAQVLIHENDFFDLTWAYLTKCKEQNIVHTELFFDPQTHTDRGIDFKTVIHGIHKALQKGEKELHISFKLILCFLRHLDEESAFKTLEEATPYQSIIDGIGLDSSEVGHPPSKFKRVFQLAHKQGYKIVAHAGEEGPAEYIWEAINKLNVHRIDHGNNCLDDAQLVSYLAQKKLGLTLCPLSNLELKVINHLKDYPLLDMMNKNLMVTINSDDPAYFGGYINENFIAIAEALSLNKQHIVQLVKNSVLTSFLSHDEKKNLLHKIEQFTLKA